MSRKRKGRADAETPTRDRQAGAPGAPHGDVDFSASPPTRRAGAPRVSVSLSSVDPFRRWLLAGMTAALVARLLFPSESAASQGDDLPLAMLWIALTVIWLVATIGRKRFTLRFGPVDAAVLVLVAWQCIAAVHAVRYGSPRPALNMLWESVGLGMLFFLARQLIHDAQEVRAVVAVMIAVMAGISVYGIYQSAIEMPATERQYYADKEGELRAAELSYPPGSPFRDLFEKRLKNREPLATFALTNSLAAALAPWLVMGLGLIASVWHERRRWIAWTICLAPIAACLLLTKSRSAYVAVAVGIIWLAVTGWRRRRVGRRARTRSDGRRVPPGETPEDGGTRFTRPTLRLLRWLPVTALLIGLLAAAVLIAGFARPALAKAATSLSYRVEYWRATLQMIAHRPLLGCGPGNFQDVYTQYKLPEASEVVSDPHNFLLEVWATAGTPALLALLAVLGLFWVSCRVGLSQSFNPEPAATGCAVAATRCAVAAGSGLNDGLTPSLLSGGDWKFVLVGAVGGFLLSIPLGQISSAPPNIGAIVIGLPVAVVCTVLLVPWVRSGAFPPALAGVGVGVLLVDLLATGGMGIPAVAQSLWLLLAVGLNGAWPRHPQAGTRPRAVAIVLLAIGLGLLAACHQTSYARVLPCQSSQRQARRELLDGDRKSALEALQRAVDADPYSSDAHSLLADTCLDSWLENLRPADYDAFEHHDALARQLAPEAAPIWRASAERYRRAYAKTDARGWRAQPRAIEQAIPIARRTAELYPGSGGDRAALAILYQLSGDEVSYRREAQAALELDRRTPHEDKKLRPDLRRRLEAAAEEPK